MEEYCIQETFDAKCQHDEVIIMQHALYGRMALGRCVTYDMGKLDISIVVFLRYKCQHYVSF